MLERAGSAPYADVVAARMLRPLGMTRSTFRPLVAMTWPLALDYRVGPSKVSGAWYLHDGLSAFARVRRRAGA